MRKIVYSFALLLIVSFSYSQSTPLTDPAIWTLDFQDDFNYSSISTFTNINTSGVTGNYTVVNNSSGNTTGTTPAKWGTNDWRSGLCPQDHSAGVNDDESWNAKFNDPDATNGNYEFTTGSPSGLGLADDGMLTIAVKSISSTPRDPSTVSGSSPYGTGVVNGTPGGNCTKNFIYSAPKALKTEGKRNWKYGFFEIRCRLPVTGAAAGKSNRGIGANFWLTPGGNQSLACYSEIDIFEFVNGINTYFPTSGNIYQQLRTFCSHYIALSVPCSTTRISTARVDSDINDGLFHTYAVAWYPDRLEYFRDGVLVNNGIITNNQDNMDAMFLQVDFNVFTGSESIDTDNTDGLITQLPYTYDIDYVRVYKQTFQCTTPVVQSSYTFPGTDNGVVKQYYQVGGSSGSSPLSSGTFYMRAGNSATNNGYVELKSGFEVQSGATFVAETVLCQ